MLNEINAIGSGKESLASSYASSIGSQGVSNTGSLNCENKTSDVSSARPVCDTVDVEGPEQGEDAEPSNLQALKNSFSLNQGFESGIQPSFAMNSSTGVHSGLEQGVQPAGIFKSP